VGGVCTISPKTCSNIFLVLPRSLRKEGAGRGRGKEIGEKDLKTWPHAAAPWRQFYLSSIAPIWLIESERGEGTPGKGRGGKCLSDKMSRFPIGTRKKETTGEKKGEGSKKKKNKKKYFITMAEYNTGLKEKKGGKRKENVYNNFDYCILYTCWASRSLIKGGSKKKRKGPFPTIDGGIGFSLSTKNKRKKKGRKAEGDLILYFLQFLVPFSLSLASC